MTERLAVQLFVVVIALLAVAALTWPMDALPALAVVLVMAARRRDWPRARVL